jgi:hypothetical protein
VPRLTLYLKYIASASQHCSVCDVSFCEKCKTATHVGKYLERHKFVSVSQRQLKCVEHPDQVLDLATDDMVK